MLPRSERKLHLKDVVTIITLLSVIMGGITSAVAWLHAEVVLPKILHETHAQTTQLIDRHSKIPHEGAVTQREFRLWSEQVLKRLEAIETAIREQKAK